MTEGPIDVDPTALEARAERGARALPGLPPPDPARTAALLADIPPALGVTFVSPLFSALAVWPDWLEAAWTNSSRRLGTSTWNAAVDRVRAVSRDTAPTGATGVAIGPGLAAYLRLLDGLLPRLLVLARAWGDADGSGGPPDGQGSRPLLDVSVAPVGEVDATASRLLDDLAAAHGHPRVLSVYRSVAAGGSLFAAEAPALVARAGRPGYEALRGAVREAAVCPGLADGVPAPPSGAADILALFGMRLIPDLVLDTAWLRARADPQGAPA